MWTCRLIDFDEVIRNGGRPRPGDMWYAPGQLEGEDAEFYRAHFLAPRYFREWAARRPPLYVMLPDGTRFCVDSQASGGSDGWQVTGEPPLITVRPSINILGSYHGYITEGRIGDDVEGRRFAEG